MDDILERIASKCSHINGKKLKLRAIANLVAAYTLQEYIVNQGYSVDTSTSLQNSPFLRTHLDYAEIYVNNCRIVARYTFDNKLYIPKKLIEYNLLGDYLAFVSITNRVNVLGFIPSAQIKENIIDNRSLLSFDDIKYNLGKVEIQEEIDSLNKSLIDIIKYFSGEIDNKAMFFDKLSKSAYLREKFIEYDITRFILMQMSQAEKDIKNALHEESANISHLADMFIQTPSSFDWRGNMS